MSGHGYSAGLIDSESEDDIPRRSNPSSPYKYSDDEDSILAIAKKVVGTKKTEKPKKVS